MHTECPSIDTWHAGVPRSSRPFTGVGFAILVLWLASFGVWAGFAPIEGAVVAPGSFVATGQNKQVQHLEGGIVREILVREGDLVHKGQVLLRLDDTVPVTKVERLTKRYHHLLVMQARLRSEARAEESFQVPEQLSALRDDVHVASLVALQREEQRARQTRMRDEIEVLRKEIAGIEESIAGFQSLLAATDEQLKLFREERADKEALAKRSLVRRADVLAVQRADARLEGDRGQYLSRIADSRERIARASQQMAQIQSAAVQKALEELRQTETELHDISEQIRAAQEVASRIEVTAPVQGVVVKLNHHTPGGVVGAGATILELLPIEDELIIESRLLPSDISNVQAGQLAQVRVAALNQRMTPMIDGHVVYVSADAVSETNPQALSRLPMASHGVFIVRVKLDEADLKAKAPDFRPMPGMPVDVFVKTGQRTFLQYLLQPLRDSFNNAFREH